jgi:hypothetical protein
LYLVTHSDDVPFLGDEIRDGEHLRAWMTERCAERLAERAFRLELLRGNRAERLARALMAVGRLLAEGFAKDFVDAADALG